MPIGALPILITRRTARTTTLWDSETFWFDVFVGGGAAFVAATIIVIIGLIGEARKSSLEWLSWHPFFEMLVIVGIAGELFSDGTVIFASLRMETISGREIASLRDRASNAELELAKIKKPRELNISAAFSEVGRKYLEGTKFDLWANPDWEPMELALKVRDALASIGMEEQRSATPSAWNPPAGGMPVGSGILRSGVAVRVCKDALQPRTRAAVLAQLLSNALGGTHENPVTIEPWDTSRCSEPDLLHVEIGSKALTPWVPPAEATVVYPEAPIPRNSNQTISYAGLSGEPYQGALSVYKDRKIRNPNSKPILGGEAYSRTAPPQLRHLSTRSLTGFSKSRPSARARRYSFLRR